MDVPQTHPPTEPALTPRNRPDLWRGAWGRAMGATLGLLAAYVGWFFLVPDGAQAHPALNDAVFFPFEIAAIAFTWHASRATALDGRTRRAWRIIAIAYLCIILSNVMNFLGDVRGHALLELLSNAPSALYQVLLLAGLLAFPSAPRTGPERTKLWLDVATIQLAAAALLWEFALRPMAIAAHSSAVSNGLAMLFPIGDLAVVLVMVVVLLRGAAPGSRAALRIFLAGLLIELVADFAYSRMAIANAYRSGAGIDLLWAVGDVAVALSGHVQRLRAGRAPADRGPARRPRINLAPYAAVAAVFGALLAASRHPDADALQTLVVGAIALTCLVIARQLVSLRENAQLVDERIAQEGRFRSLVQKSSDVISIIDAGGAIRYQSPSIQCIFGYPVEAMLGHTLLDLAHPDDAPRLDRYLREAATSGREPGPITWRLRHRDGSFRQCESVGTDLRHDPSVAGVVVNSRDVSERAGLEEQLRQAQKMEAIGRLAGGIAHDFNNLLTAIRANAELLRDGASLTPGQEEELLEIERSAARGAGLTRQLLAFSRKQVLQARVVPVDEVVRGMEPMLRRLIVNDIALEIRLSAPLGQVKIDPGQLEQVVMNLALNARDAMPRGGTLTIATADAALELRAARAEAGLLPGRYVTLAVRDTGIGMDEEVQSRLFEPFFTTKPKGEGTGLGLPTVFGIVTQAGGHIGVVSAPGAGSTFTISLPRFVGEDATAIADQAPPPVPRGSETILVADDEDAIRIAVRRYLQKQGYTVLAARSGSEAMERARQHGGRIDLLLTDMVMPGMSGRELIDVLATERPDTRVLCMSGFTDDATLRAGARGGAFIQKPFALDELSRHVRRVLERPVDDAVIAGATSDA